VSLEERRSLCRLKQSAAGRDLEDWFAAEAEIRASDAAPAPWVEEEATGGHAEAENEASETNDSWPPFRARLPLLATAGATGHWVDQRVDQNARGDIARVRSKRKWPS
jgi:hypothetical protein